MRETWIYMVVLIALLLGGLLFEGLKRWIKPRQSTKRAGIFLLVFLAFLVIYSGGMVWLVRLIFGKPS